MLSYGIKVGKSSQKHEVLLKLTAIPTETVKMPCFHALSVPQILKEEAYTKFALLPSSSLLLTPKRLQKQNGVKQLVVEQLLSQASKILGNQRILVSSQKTRS